MDRSSTLAPLGTHRLRLLGCLGGDTPRAPGYFEPTAGEDVVGAFERHVRRLVAEWGHQTDGTTVSLLAAARLLSGELGAAATIVATFPPTPIKLDHGAGYCRTAHLAALRAALPLPPALAEPALWLAGSETQAALLRWLEAEGSRLVWQPAEGVYRLG